MSEGVSVCADVEAGGVHIRLSCEHTPRGVKVSVFEVDSREWIARFEPANDIEQGKAKAEELTKEYLETCIHAKLPTIVWRKCSEPS
jgi:hypothetical protein